MFGTRGQKYVAKIIGKPEEVIKERDMALGNIDEAN